MKALFKLQNEPIEGYGRIIYIPEKIIGEVYKWGSLGTLHIPARIPFGFYGEVLNFENWLKKYNIKIV